MRLLVVMLAMVLAAPFATATNIFSDPICVGADRCVDPVVCVTDVTCQPTTCSPIAMCDGSFSMEDACHERTEIEGYTCQSSIQTRAASVDNNGRATGASLGVVITRGAVDAKDLVNSWDSSTVAAGLAVLGADLGIFTLTLYRSDISSSNDVEVTQVGFALAHSGGLGVVVGIILFDDVPEHCFARVENVGGVDCPRPPPQVPTLP